MEKFHKEILVTQRANLVENLNMNDGLFTQLIARKVINNRMMRTMTTGKTVDQQAEALLDELPKRGPKAFDLFCEALNEDFQEDIVTLYLKPAGESPEIDINRNVSVTTQESSATANQVSDRDSNSSTSCLSPVATATQEVDVSVPENSGNTGSQSQAQTVAITEEYQQQIYRRSIEARGQDSSHLRGHDPHIFQPTTATDDNGETDLQKNAQIFYQSLRDPLSVTNSVFSVLNDPRLSSIEKDKIFGSIGTNVPPLKSFSLVDTGDSLLKKENPLLVKDFQESSRLEQSPSKMSSLNLHSELYSQHPNVFKAIPSTVMSSIPSSSPLKQGSLQNVQAFSFQTTDIPRQHLSPLKYSSSHTAIDNNGSNMAAIPSLIHSNHAVLNAPIRTLAETNPDHQSVPTLCSIERESVEMPRYIEINRPGSGIDMVSMTRHVERMPHGTVDLSRLQNEELAKRGANSDSTRLERNDSVDAMAKRPFAENQESNGKRYREDTDSMSSLQPPEKLSTQNMYTKLDNTIVTIPVMETARQATSDLLQGQRSLPGVMDDPGRDQTDGAITVAVETCTKQFYLTHYRQAYEMKRIPRGKALILNVNEVVGKTERRGTDIDRDNLHNLLCQLHFDVTVYNDEDGLTAKEMVLKLQDFSQDAGHKHADCTFVCILSHGDEGYIFGSDGKKFELDAIFQLFDNTCCGNLRGKPKVFIVQACRGGALDHGLQYYPDEHDGSDARVRQVPSMSDMLICYPTQNGYYAWRNRDRGSWYVESLVQVFMKYAKCEDICAMLNRVNLMVSKKVSHCPSPEMDQMSQMSEYKSTLRMPYLYLFPGIGTVG